MGAPIRTPEQAAEWFRATGTPITVWARAHGFAPTVVYALLNGRTRGLRGAAHHAAVALGLKRDASGAENSLTPLTEGQIMPP